MAPDKFQTGCSECYMLTFGTTNSENFNCYQTKITAIIPTPPVTLHVSCCNICLNLQLRQCVLCVVREYDLVTGWYAGFLNNTCWNWYCILSVSVLVLF